MHTPTPPTKAPGRIMFIAWLNIIFGSLAMLGSFAQPAPEGFFALLFGGFALATGIGLLKLLPWGRHMAIGGYGLNLLASLAQLNLVVAVLSGFVLAYLFSESVKAAFAAQKPTLVAFPQEAPNLTESAVVQAFPLAK
jgi:hypothetical protein